MVFLGERSIGKDRISEILALVNRMEKTTPPDFSIRVFGSVFVSGSQRIYRTLSPRLTAEVEKIAQISWVGS
jgi:hypothetical protein